MKYTLYINQVMAEKLGITNISQAIIFDCLTTASTWATPETMDGEIYYWVARQYLVKELPLLNLKPDTVYRYLKALAALKVIDYTKKGKKDLIRVTELGKTYLSDTMSENNPSSYVGNKSEQNSENNPTDPTTNKILLLLDNAPAEFNREAFEQYMAFRKENKQKPYTAATVKGRIKWMISQGDHSVQQAIVDQTILNGWQGLHELKKGNPQNGNSEGFSDQNLGGFNRGKSYQQPNRKTRSEQQREAALRTYENYRQSSAANAGAMGEDGRLVS